VSCAAFEFKLLQQFNSCGIFDSEERSSEVSWEIQVAGQAKLWECWSNGQAHQGNTINKGFALWKS
jgi:hypothetical protein